MIGTQKSSACCLTPTSAVCAWHTGALKDLGSGDVLKWRKEGCAEEASDEEEGDGTVSLVRRVLVNWSCLHICSI